MEDRRVIELLSRFHSLREVGLPSIIPIAGSGYTINRYGVVIGLKIGSITQEGIDLVMNLRGLERLVLSVRDELGSDVAYEIPAAISELKNLSFVWLSGFRKLPPQIMSLNLEVLVDDLDENISLQSKTNDLFSIKSAISDFER